MNIQKTMATVAGLIALAFSSVSGAHAGTTTIVSGTSGGTLVSAGTATTDTVVSYNATTASGPFGALTLPSPSDSTILAPPSSGTQNPFAANPRVPAPTYHAAIPGSSWISPYLNNTSNNQYQPTTGAPSSNFQTPGGYYLYSTTFTLDAAQTAFSVGGGLLSDDTVVAAYLDYGTANQSTVTFTNGSPAYSKVGSFSGSGVYGTGTHTLDFIVKNTVHTATALDFGGTAVPEPATIAAFLIAFLCIGGMMLRARKSGSVTASA